MIEHTQGPLTIHGPSPGGPLDDDGGDYAIRDGDGYIVGEAYHKVDFVVRRPAKENAQLWAASSDLLAACKSFVSFYPSGINPYLDSAYGDAIDAIKKAEGR